MDLTLDTAQGKLNIRVAAVILNEGKILIESNPRVNYSVLPGGRVQFCESAQDAVKRELTEELGGNPQIIRPLYVHQNFFDMDGERFHEICFFFLVRVDEDICKKQVFRGGDNLSQYSWIDVRELKNIPFYPHFLQNSINNLPSNVVFITEVDDKEQ